MEKNKLMMIIIIVLLVVLLGTIGAVSFYALKIMSGVNTSETVQHQGTAATRLKAEEIHTIDLSKAISTNLLTGADGKDHVISVSISVGIDNTQKKKSEEFIAMIEAKESILRDTCISLIGKKTYEELNTPEGQDALKADILAQLQDQFQSNMIVKVYFSNYYTE